MNCAYLVNGQPCGVDDAEPYMNFPVCDRHRDSVSGFLSLRGRTTALQASKYHSLDSFPGWCYIVLVPGGLVKIGYSNTEELLRTRLRDLRHDVGGPVVSLATLKGGFVAEAVLHNRFNAYRVPGPGELFYYSPEIAEYVASLP